MLPPLRRGARRFDPLPLDARQREEVLLTAAQSLFAVTLLLDALVIRGFPSCQLFLLLA